MAAGLGRLPMSFPVNNPWTSFRDESAGRDIPGDILDRQTFELFFNG